MKVLLVFLAGLCAIALATPVADKTRLEKQKKVLGLFYRIHQTSTNPEHVEIAKTFNLNDHVDSYKKPEVVKAFIQHYKYDLLPRGEIFSVANERHLQQAISLFKLFYYSNDWETFYQTAAWARQNVNEGIFVYALTVALVHHPEGRHYVLPPIYEIFPHYFFGSEVINKASQLKQSSEHKVDTYIDSNYSGWYLNLHEEQAMSYYLEDVDINAGYYYFHIFYPTWMSSEEYGWSDEAKRGEVFFAYYQQILARYYLERLSNGFGQIPYLDIESPIETPYEPSLVYPNGLQFPSRPKFANLHEYFYNYGQKWTHNVYGYSLNFVRDYDRRIADAIDSGLILTEKGKFVELFTDDGLNTLGNLIQSNHDSPNYKYYGPAWIFIRHLLGYSYQSFDDHRLVPSALEHFETTLRDPVYFQIIKKVVSRFQRYFSKLHPYTEKELSFPGVKITSFDVDELVTYDDHFYADLTNAVWYAPGEQPGNFKLRVRQSRLNHKQFSYKIHVKSDKAQKSFVKVFLGPKYDEYGRHINLTENRLNFIELEQFVYELQAGENVITRHCHQAFWYGPDRVSDHVLYQQVVQALEGNGEFNVDVRQNFFSLPQRYMLPRGSENGTPFQFFAIVYPYVPYKGKERQELQEMPKVGSGDIFQDNNAVLFPFDRFIQFENMWSHAPNIHFHEERIYHKDIHEVNAPHH